MTTYNKIMAYSAMSLLKLTGSLSLGSRVALIILGSSLVTVLVIVSIAYQALVDDFEDLLTQRQALETTRMAERVDQKIELRLNALTAFASQLPDGDSLPPAPKLQAALKRQSKLRELFPASLLVFDDQARAIAENIPVEGRIGTSYLDRAHFRRALETRQPLVSKPIVGRVTGKPLLSFLAPILSDKGDLLGFAGGTLDLTETSLLPELNSRNGVSAGVTQRIIDTENFLQVDSGSGSQDILPLPNPGEDNLIDAALSGITFGQVIDDQGELLIYAAHHLQRLGWMFVRAVPYGRATVPARESFSRFAIIALLVALILAIISYILARGTMSPLDRMTARVQRMSAQPDSAFRLREVGTAEVRNLARAFNQLLAEREALANMKDHFMSSVSHELRTPLTSMNGALRLIASGATGRLDENTQKMANLALRNGERLQLLISDLLDLNKLSEGSMKTEICATRLAPVVSEAIGDNATMAADNGVTLTCKVAEDLTCLADSHRLRQVLDNYISNAIKFSPVDGSVSVSAGKTASSRVRITVSDQGPGVPETFSGEVFKRFAQAETGTTRSIKGTGLGLAICYELAKLMNGSVGYYNDNGAHFWIELPTPETPVTESTQTEAQG
ncbi:ATP-binding protein [uncultured Marinobacter sp.]|uniref:sensor histidine kinase n=1 Tax=uncultured Marinobacter sp. TaxID=187379 RepID=UPI0026290DE2|nr:ATP-binding protein [uncultured Marinobacter sp.]